MSLHGSCVFLGRLTASNLTSFLKTEWSDNHRLFFFFPSESWRYWGLKIFLHVSFHSWKNIGGARTRTRLCRRFFTSCHQRKVAEVVFGVFCLCFWPWQEVETHQLCLQGHNRNRSLIRLKMIHIETLTGRCHSEQVGQVMSIVHVHACWVESSLLLVSALP